MPDDCCPECGHLLSTWRVECSYCGLSQSNFQLSKILFDPVDTHAQGCIIWTNYDNDMDRAIDQLNNDALDIANQMVQPEVFERLLTIVIELAVEGKEGRPLGTMFVLGDHEKVMSMSNQMVINPFAAVPDAERNMLDPALKETLREFSTIDGAVIIRDDGVVLAVGLHLAPSAETTELSQGLGARHRSAAGITALTNSIAVVISESTGDVRIFSRWKLFMEIEKAKKETI